MYRNTITRENADGYKNGPYDRPRPVYTGRGHLATSEEQEQTQVAGHATGRRNNTAALLLSGEVNKHSMELHRVCCFYVQGTPLTAQSGLPGLPTSNTVL